MKVSDRLKASLYKIVKSNPRVNSIVKSIWKTLFRSIHFFQTLWGISPPKEVISNAYDWLQAFNKKASAGIDATATYYLVSDYYVLQRKDPIHLEEHSFWKFEDSSNMHFPSVFAMKIPNGRVYHEGYVLTPDNYLLNEVSKTIDKGEYLENSTHPLLHKKKLPRAKKIKGSLAVLSADSGQGYYHWMFDVLPRIEILRKAKINLGTIDYFLVNSTVGGFHVETLQELGILRKKVLESYWHQHLQADQLIVPSLVGNTGVIPKWTCEFLRRSFLSNGSTENRRTKRIYINRSQVAHRKIINEPELIRFLEKKGFENITLEKLSVKEQAHLFSSCEVVLAPHGAGLSNIVFCQKHTKIIELLNPMAVNLMYWSLSSQNDLDYCYFFAEGDRPSKGENPYLNSENLYINIDSLKKLLEKLKL